MINKLKEIWRGRGEEVTITDVSPSYASLTDGYISTSSSSITAVDPTVWDNANRNSRYALTDDGLQALVDGKLSCEKIIHEDPSVRPGSFYVSYDSIVYCPASNRVQLVWKGVTIMEIQVPVVDHGNTLTISGLIGKVPLEIST